MVEVGVGFVGCWVVFFCGVRGIGDEEGEWSIGLVGFCKDGVIVFWFLK